MKRMIRLLAGCLLSLCLLLPGVTALAAPDDTGEVIDPSLPAAAGRAGTPEEETGSPSGTEVGDPGDFTLGEDGRLQASTAFFLTIEKAPSGGGSSGGGSGDSGGILRPLVPLDVKIIEEIPIPVSPIPDTGDGSLPPALLFALLASSGAAAALCARRKKDLEPQCFHPGSAFSGKRGRFFLGSFNNANKTVKNG